MSKYKSILTRREDLKSEVAMMEEKNLKLEQELESKLKEKINEDLAFPPTKILSVGGEKELILRSNQITAILNIVDTWYSM